MRALFTVASAIVWLLIAGFMWAVGMVITLDVPGGMLFGICLLVGHILPLRSFDGPHLYRKGVFSPDSRVRRQRNGPFSVLVTQ